MPHHCFFPTTLLLWFMNMVSWSLVMVSLVPVTRISTFTGGRVWEREDLDVQGFRQLLVKRAHVVLVDQFLDATHSHIVVATALKSDPLGGIRERSASPGFYNQGDISAKIVDHLSAFEPAFICRRSHLPQWHTSLRPWYHTVPQAEANPPLIQISPCSASFLHKEAKRPVHSGIITCLLSSIKPFYRPLHHGLDLFPPLLQHLSLPLLSLLEPFHFSDLFLNRIRKPPPQ
jgi:hypothetical protein